jgi:hypothetical protein
VGRSKLLSLAALHDASPVKIDGRVLHAEEVVDAMFPGDPWLCSSGLAALRKAQ